jgi:hypothetical protein
LAAKGPLQTVQARSAQRITQIAEVS